MTPFPYFGTKKKLIKYYQPPQYDMIIEPFAGAAGYACTYGLERDVWINDIYDKVYQIWKWIQNATKSDINNLPKLDKKGQTLADCKQLSDPERWLLGFATGVGRAQPSNKVTSFAQHREGTVQVRRALMRLCGNISHWKITNDEYFTIPNFQATWFCDPPYQKYGKHYAHNEKGIDFHFLGKWCKKRKGQVIVCEGSGADWLPFQPLCIPLKRLQRKDSYSEVIYYQSDKKVGMGIF